MIITARQKIGLDLAGGDLIIYAESHFSTIEQFEIWPPQMT